MDLSGAQTYLLSLYEAYRLHYEAAQRRFPASLIRMSQGDTFAQIAGLRKFSGIKTDLLQAARTIAHKDVGAMLETISACLEAGECEASYIFERIEHLHRLYAAVPEDLLSERENLRQRGYIMLGHAQDSRRHEKTGFGQQLIKAAMSNGRIESDTPMSHAEKVFKNARRISEKQANALSLATPYDANLLDFTPGISVQDYAPLIEDIFETACTFRQEALRRQKQKERPQALPEFTFEQGQKLLSLIGDLLPIPDKTYETHLLRGFPSMCMGELATIRFISNPLILAETIFHERIAHLTYRYNARNTGGILGFHMDEARALSMERFFLREETVLQAISKILVEAYGAQHESFLFENLLRHVRWTKEDISDRTSSDDLTYVLQETIRSRTELRVMNGALSVKDMPDFMAAETEKAFGLTNVNGYHIMRETFQWPLCMHGHVAAYPLGLVIGVQLHHKAKFTLNNQLSDVSKGVRSPYFDFMCNCVDVLGVHQSVQSILDLNYLGSMTFSPKILFSYLKKIQL